MKNLIISFLLGLTFTLVDKAYSQELPFSSTIETKVTVSNPYFTLSISTLSNRAFHSFAFQYPDKSLGKLQYSTDQINWKTCNFFHEYESKQGVYQLIFIDKKASNIYVKLEHPGEELLTISQFSPFSTGYLETHTPLANSPSISIAQRRTDCPCAYPPICDRSCWCPSDDCDIPTYDTTSTTHLIIHHSAGQNVSDDFAAIVRSYWNFHVNVNGWDDIGYNWLIDPDGVIYEGRSSGNRGAHFSCMNSGAMGYCMIGNYEVETPSDSTIQSLKNLLAAELCLYQLSPLDSLQNEFYDYRLPVIAAHRDGNEVEAACTTTVCPGDSLYYRLEDIREDIASEYPCLSTLVSAEEINPEEEYFNIYPNPNTSHFRIESSPEAVVKIYTLGGSPVSYEKINDAYFLKEKGVFLVQILTPSGKISVAKVLVQ